MNRLILLMLLILTACVGAPDVAPGTAGGSPSAASLAVTSPAFAQDTAIPEKYTCHGEDVSPALEWAEPPQGTKSLALIMDDPDAPVGTWVHWVVYNLPPDTRGLPESASQGGSAQVNLPPGAQLGKNSFNRINYGGPCPPSGEHHYRFHVFALDTMLSGELFEREALLKAMDGHVLGQGELVGLYKKP